MAKNFEEKESRFADKIIVKKDATVYADKEYQLKKGEELPKEIQKGFHSSFKTEGII